MCTRVWNKDTNEETDSPAEFAEMLGIPTSSLPVDNAYKQLIPEGCLCQVDIEKACDMFGFNYIDDAGDAQISKKSQGAWTQQIAKTR
jgi:hypothetical protein